MSIVFALASLLFAGCNDFLFKKQAAGGGARGRYMAVVGVVWMALFAAIGGFLRGSRPTAAALLWGLVAGLFSAVANYLLIWSMKRLDASVGSTVYRLNMIPAALLAFLFLGEAVTLRKALGLAIGIVAVLLFMNGGGGGRKRAGAEPALWIAVLASVLRALMGLAYKMAAAAYTKPEYAAAGPQQEWFLSVQGAVWIAVGLVAALFLEPPSPLSRRNAAYGIVSGFLVCGVVQFFAKALELGEASVIIPISQMSFLVTTLLSWPLMKERFHARKAAGLCLAVAAILCLSMA